MKTPIMLYDKNWMSFCKGCKNAIFKEDGYYCAANTVPAPAINTSSLFGKCGCYTYDNSAKETVTPMYSCDTFRRTEDLCS